MTRTIDRWALRAPPAAMLVCLLPATAQGQTAPTYAQLLQGAGDAPRIAEGQAEVERAQGLALQARARPNPSVSLLTENVIGSSPYRLFDRAETTVQYSQPFELGGKRQARIRAGEAGVTAAEARAREIRIDFAYELARAYAGAEIADRRVTIAEDELEEASADLDMAHILVGSGRDAQLRAIQAESEASAAKAMLEVARANRIAAYSRLAAVVGSETDFTALAESLLASAAAENPQTVFDFTASPALRAAEANLEAARRRLDSERKRTIPDITGTFGARRLEGDNAVAAVAGVTLPLRIFDRNRGNIAASGAEVRAAEARVAILRNDLGAASRGANAQIAAERARVTAARDALTTAEETYRLARIAYESGKSPLAELLTARHALGAARTVILDAEAARFDLLAQLARLQGRTVTGDQIP